MPRKLESFQSSGFRELLLTVSLDLAFALVAFSSRRLTLRVAEVQVVILVHDTFGRSSLRRHPLEMHCDIKFAVLA